MLEFIAWMALATGQYAPADVKLHLEAACKFVGGLCPELPRGIYTRFQWGLWGSYYYGTNVVLISNYCQSGDLEKVDCDGILRHELVHYVLDMQGRLRGADNACADEALAWAAYNDWVLSNNRPDLLNDHWRMDYDCEVL